jgi:hypothetical protein
MMLPKSVHPAAAFAVPEASEIRNTQVNIAHFESRAVIEITPLLIGG